jgi:hypothetical protein
MTAMVGTPPLQRVVYFRRFRVNFQANPLGRREFPQFPSLLSKCISVCARTHRCKVPIARKCRKLWKYAGLRLVHARKFPRTTQGLPPPSRYYQRPKHKGNSDHVMLVVTNFFK